MLELLRQAFDGMPQLVKILDRDGRLVYTNPAMARFIDLRDDGDGTLFERVDPALSGVLERCHREALEALEPITAEIELGGGDDMRTLACTRIPLRVDGELAAVCTIATDVTEHQRIDQELARTTGQLRAMIEAHEDVVMLVNRDGEIQFINYTLNLPREQVIGRSMFDFVPGPFQDHARAVVERVQETHQPEEFESPYIAEDGTTSYWEARVFPVLTDGEVSLMTVVAADVTARRSQEEERNRFFNISEDILCTLDAQGVFVRINPACERTLGMRPEEMIGKSFGELIHPDDRETTQAAFAASVEGAPGTGEVINRYRHADGSYRSIAWRGAFDPVTQVAYGVGRDVTERIALEDKLRHAQKMEAVGQLAGGIAHDFNNIALSILLNAELGLRSETDDVVPKSFREIRDAAQRAADLTRQLLAFSRQSVANFELLDLNHIADGVVLLLRRLFPESISVEFIRGEVLPAVRADRGQLEQVIMNLCLNARDAMPDGGRVELETKAVVVKEGDAGSELPPGKHVLLSVSDTGAGIDSALISRIFEPFFTTKPPGSGTGLGLATVYGVVQQHDAMIHVESEPGVGTRFEIHLPASNRRVSRTVRDEVPSQVEGGSETILLAEDEPLVRAVVVRTLNDAGYAVVVASDGAEAVAVAMREPDIHLALLDMVMPNMSGTEAYERIREFRPDMRFLFSSGYVGELPRPEVDGVPIPLIRKPYRPDQLLREIRRVLEG